MLKYLQVKNNCCNYAPKIDVKYILKHIKNQIK